STFSPRPPALSPAARRRRDSTQETRLSLMSLALHSLLSGVPASIPSPPVGTFPVFGLTIHFYALCIIAGIIAAALITNHRLTARGAEKWVVIDIAILAVPLAIIGARIFHVLTQIGRASCRVRVSSLVVDVTLK